jgi:hypothetical protein
MAEVLLSATYDKTAWIARMPHEPIAGPYGRVINADPLECRPELLRAAVVPFTNPAYIKEHYYNCLTYEDDLIYAHNRRHGLTTVYSAAGKYRITMQSRIKKSHAYRGWHTWCKIIAGPRCLYATNGRSIFYMEKCPLVALLPPEHAQLMDAIRIKRAFDTEDDPQVLDDQPDSLADWSTLLNTKIWRQRELRPSMLMYAEDANHGISDMALYGDDLFVKVSWRSYVTRITNGARRNYELGPVDKMAVNGSRLYCASQTNMSVYDIEQLSQNTKPLLVFKISVAQRLVAYGRFIIVVAAQHTHIYTADGVYCDTAYFPEPIIDFCPVMGGFLVSHPTHCVLYK